MYQYYELHRVKSGGINIFYTVVPKDTKIFFHEWLNYDNGNEEFFKYIDHVDDNLITYYVNKNTMTVFDESKKNIVGIFYEETNLIQYKNNYK